MFSLSIPNFTTSFSLVKAPQNVLQYALHHFAVSKNHSLCGKRIGHGFLRSKGFGSDQEQGFLRGYFLQCFRDVRAINIAYKISFDAFLPNKASMLPLPLQVQGRFRQCRCSQYILSFCRCSLSIHHYVFLYKSFSSAPVPGIFPA